MDARSPVKAEEWDRYPLEPLLLVVKVLIGSKVFMDARLPVTQEEGDRYSLESPVLK